MTAAPRHLGTGTVVRVRLGKKAIAALWNDVPIQRCTVHKHRNLLAA